jgi:hypothetical protein
VARSHADGTAGRRHVGGRIIGADRLSRGCSGRGGAVDIAGIGGIADASAVPLDGIANHAHGDISIRMADLGEGEIVYRVDKTLTIGKGVYKIGFACAAITKVFCSPATTTWAARTVSMLSSPDSSTKLVTMR